jgi:hypothetical protein
MTIIVYLGKADGIRIPMRAVTSFNADPWSNA